MTRVKTRFDLFFPHIKLKKTALSVMREMQLSTLAIIKVWYKSLREKPSENNFCSHRTKDKQAVLSASVIVVSD